MAKRILIICKAPVGSKMSSPGIRALNMARVLARALPEAAVTLGVPSATDLVPDARFRVVVYSRWTLPALVQKADVVIGPGFAPYLIPSFFGRRFVMDYFTNFMVEGLEHRLDQVSARTRQAWLETQRVYVNLQLTLADFVICTNERQRDAWLGSMSCLGLIPGSVYDRDNTLRRLVDVAAYGIRPELPSHENEDPNRVSARLIKGAIPGIGNNDQVMMWNGGILHWYDPAILIRAVARLVPTHPRLRLLFLGVRYPVAEFDPGSRPGEAFRLARELGLLDTHVIFNDGWLPYDDSGRAMLEADIGVSTYYDNLETHFSYRTRMIDFLWAGTPVVCTRGDVIAEMVEQRGLGLTVPERDEDALADALARLLDDPDLRARCRANLAMVREEMSWERTLAPLVEFCRNPQPIARGKWFRAPDLASRTARYLHARVLEQVKSRLEISDRPNPGRVHGRVRGASTADVPVPRGPLPLQGRGSGG